MRVVLMASGTRGDVQPMLALGIGLRDAGHRVRVVAGSNFAAWIEACGLEAFPTLDMEALMRSEMGVAWTEGANQRAQLRTMRALLAAAGDWIVRDTIASCAGAELLIGGFLSEPFNQAVCERQRIPQITVALQPYRATRAGAASMMALLPRANSAANLWIGHLGERLMFSIAADVLAKLRVALDLPPHKSRSYLRAARRIPALYAFSRHVVPPVEDTNTATTGYLFHDTHEPPPDSLRRFVEAGAPPIYIGFGSMPSSDPRRVAELVVAALRHVDRRCVLARGWSGAADLELPDDVFLLDGADHGWLFSRVAAVAHHGGAGTTAAGLRAGKPTLVVPHMADQPFWGRRVYELRVGPRPLPRGQMTAETLARRLDALVSDAEMARTAADLGAHIRAEDGVARAVETIERLLK